MIEFKEIFEKLEELYNIQKSSKSPRRLPNLQLFKKIRLIKQLLLNIEKKHKLLLNIEKKHKKEIEEHTQKIEEYTQKIEEYTQKIEEYKDLLAQEKGCKSCYFL